MSRTAVQNPSLLLGLAGLSVLVSATTSVAWSPHVVLLTASILLAAVVGLAKATTA